MKNIKDFNSQVKLNDNLNALDVSSLHEFKLNTCCCCSCNHKTTVI